MTSDSFRSEQTPQVLAFYLPQFHQVPDNDAWHGPGFTEWTVVAKSNPLYPGHRQPELPAELGFYDLRVPETRYQQARLAREHGITGFLYYHYWFGGRRMLGRPFDEVLTSGEPDFPFALCWANESWYRKWQSSVDEMLIEQTFSEEDDLAHIRWMIECFKDPRYIHVDGRPLIAIYRPTFLPDSKRTLSLWRDECEKAGVASPWVVMFETDEEVTDPRTLGFDASAEFIPHLLRVYAQPSPPPAGLDPSHMTFDYDEVARAYLGRPDVPWQRYPCVATGWDNTPRRQNGEALILRHATPEGYGRWLAEAATRQKRTAGANGIVFINAWNEWAEGAHLEPDTHWGRAYLEVTRDVLLDVFGQRQEHATPSPVTASAPARIEDLYHDLYQQFVELQRLHSGILSYADRRVREVQMTYGELLQKEREDARKIADLNEAMAEQLAQQIQRMKELAVPDLPSTTWLVS